MEKMHKAILVLGIIFMISLSMITYHPDLRVFSLAGHYIRSGEVFTFYDHVRQLPLGDEIKKEFQDDVFIYPPLAYLIPAAFQLPFSGLLSSVNLILPSGALTLFILKIPMLLFSLLTLFYLPKLFSHAAHGRWAQIVWLFFPANLLVSSAIGQVDSIITFLLLLALISLKNDKLTMASVYIMLSALIKPIGLVLLPIIFVYKLRQSGFVKAVATIGPSLFIWVLFLLPYLSSLSFRLYALFGSLTAKTVYAGIQISGGTVIPWFFIIYMYLIIRLFFNRMKLTDVFGLTIISSVAFNHFHPQWFLWSVPYLLSIATDRENRFILLGFALSWIPIWLSFDPTLHIGLITFWRKAFPATFGNPLTGSSLVLLGRAAIISGLIYLVEQKKNETRS